MRYQKILLSLLLLPSLWANPLPQNVEIMVFTTQNYPIQGATLTNHIYYLDAVENLEETTGELFGTDIESATVKAKEWLKSRDGVLFQRKLQQAYIGVTEGWKLGVMKIPAVVFQKSARPPEVIYGVTDVNKAIQIYTKDLE